VDDLGQLRQLFPEWLITARWHTAASGPDVRTLYAQCGGITLSAYSAEGLAAKIRQELNRR
jgi:hypothetical protein